MRTKEEFKKYVEGLYERGRKQEVRRIKTLLQELNNRIAKIH